MQSPEQTVEASEVVRADDGLPSVRRETEEALLLEVSEMHLPQYRPEQGPMELVVAGAGPSGLAVAARVSQAGVPACCVEIGLTISIDVA